MRFIFSSFIAIALFASGEAAAQSSRQLLSDARRGDVAAMRNLGKRLIQGSGMNRDPRNGVKWLKKAADMGDSSAMLMLGDLHHNGIAVSKNEKQALRYYQMAADAGNENAAKRLEKYKVASNDTDPQQTEKTQSESDKIKAAEPEKQTETQNKNKSKEEQFFAAARSGDMEQIKRLIKEGVNINARDTNSNTALNHAIEEEHEKIALYLIEAGADIHEEADGSTPLALASVMALPSVVKQLLKSGAKINNKHTALTTPIFLAGYTPNNPKRAECVKLLLDAGADPNAPSKRSSQTVLMYAAEFGDTEIVKHLIEAGADITAKDTGRSTNGYTALLYAAINGHVETAKVLREAQGLK